MIPSSLNDPVIRRLGQSIHPARGPAKEIPHIGRATQLLRQTGQAQGVGGETFSGGVSPPSLRRLAADDSLRAFHHGSLPPFARRRREDARG